MTPELTHYSPPEAERVRDFARLVAQADGFEAFGEQTIFNLTSDHVEHFLLTDAGTVIGYAQIDHGSAELAVHPDHRRRGHGTVLLDAVKTRDPNAAVWAHGDLPAARGLAKKTGLDVTRELLYMTAPVTERTPPQPPEGITTTTFTDSDSADWVQANAEAFADHPEQGRLTVADLRERQAQDWFDPEVFWLSRDSDGRLLGYMWVKREPGADTAEIYVLGVSPAAQGRGLGKYLTNLALAHMHTAGVRKMDLYVEGDNHPALATYRAYGFTPAVTHVQYA